MTAPEKSAAETLRAASALLRERASKATPGPWNYCRIDGNGEQPEKAEIFAGPRDEHGYLDGCVALWVEEDEDGLRMSHEDGDWIGTVHPGLGEPLAAAFDYAAEVAEYALDRGYRAVAWVPRMVTVARVLLREELPGGAV